MGNVSKIVNHLKTERDRAEKAFVRIEFSLGRLCRHVPRSQTNAQEANDVRIGPQENRSRAACAMGEA